MPKNRSIAIHKTQQCDRQKIELAHQQLGYAIVDEKDQNADVDFLLSLEKNQWMLKQSKTHKKANGMFGNFQIAFHQGSVRHRQQYGGGKSQALAKAIGVQHKNHLRVLDCTAGLAKDAWVLATLGCEVLMLEEHPLLVFLISQALDDAQAWAQQNDDDELLSIVSRVTIQQGNSVDYLQQNTEIIASNIDVIYLDPMFEKRQKSAKVKKDMQYLQSFIGAPKQGVNELMLHYALEQEVSRVAVKRAASDSPIEHSLQPSFSLTGQSTRFDIYTKKALQS